MSHITHRSSYSSLVDRINRFPQGAPPSDLLNKILRMLFSESEAQCVALLLKSHTDGGIITSHHARRQDLNLAEICALHGRSE